MAEFNGRELSLSYAKARETLRSFSYMALPVVQIFKC